MTPACRIEPVRVWTVIRDADRPCDGVDWRDGTCPVRAVGHVVWLTDDWAQVETRSACGHHLAIARAAGRCLTFPYGCLPPPSDLMPAINAEIARRRPPVQQIWFGNSTFSGTGSMGGMQWIFPTR